MSHPQTRLIAVSGQKPEDVAILSTGELVTGLDDGRVVAIAPETGQIRTLVNTGGRPLGLEVTTDDQIVMCDTECGLTPIRDKDCKRRHLRSQFDCRDKTVTSDAHTSRYYRIFLFG